MDISERYNQHYSIQRILTSTLMNWPENMILLYFHTVMRYKIITEDEQYKLFEMFQQHKNYKLIMKTLIQTKLFKLIYPIEGKEDMEWTEEAVLITCMIKSIY